MNVRYALPNMKRAVSALATGTGTIQDRLFDAYVIFGPVMVDDFPAELQAEYESIREALSRIKDPTPVGTEGRQGDVMLTLAQMSDEAAQRIARALTELTAKLEDHAPRR